MPRIVVLVVALLLAVGPLLQSLPAGADRRGNNNRQRRDRPSIVTRADAVRPAAARRGKNVANWYIVETRPEAGDAGAVADGLAARFRLTISYVYREALTGFAAKIPPGQLASVEQAAEVVSVEPDRFFELERKKKKKRRKKNPPGPSQVYDPDAQVTPWGVLRIQADRNAEFQTNPVDVDVAVIDTGIDASHPDLNVAGGFDCLSTRDDWGIDTAGHGTHVAGTIGARDNAFGVVGVAPGARLYAVRALTARGGTLAQFICGIDWVAENAATIEVANMSVGGPIPRGGEGGCGAPRNAEEEAICRAYDAGVTLVAAAGNECTNAARVSPGAYDVVITVGAFADTDGKPGGLGPRTPNILGCDGRNHSIPDDTLALFTNFGPDVDLWAPGVGVLSTVPQSSAVYANPTGYDSFKWSGTSMAAPHVAGSAALYLAANPAASPDTVKQALLAQAEIATLISAKKRKNGGSPIGRVNNAPIVNNNDGPPWPPEDRAAVSDARARSRAAGSSTTDPASEAPDAAGTAPADPAAAGGERRGAGNQTKHDKDGKRGKQSGKERSKQRDRR